MEFPYPLLVCDVGGTNVRVGAVREPGGGVVRIGNVPTASHSTLLATIKPMQERAMVPARSLLVSAAGPIDGAIVRLTNADLTIDGPEIANGLGLDQGLLLNDFEAQALALPHLPEQWTRAIVAGVTIAEGPRLVLGPGTGLGAAALLDAGGAWLPVRTEAGHMSFGATDGLEQQLWPHLERVEGRVTFESVLSGPGLVRLHMAHRKLHGLPAAPAPAADIVATAVAGDAMAVDTLKLFWRLVARCAGDLALAFLARGGITLAGGVLPRLIGWLDPEDFARVFVARAPVSALVASMPVKLLTEPDAALVGLAALAAKPESFLIDYGRRAWRR